MLSAAQIIGYREQLRKLSLRYLQAGENQWDTERKLIAQWKIFAPDKAIGRQLYESFTDEELVVIMVEAYARLGRAPVQSDIFCFYRTYIKHRFVTWSAALKAAGQSRALDRHANQLPMEEYEHIKREEPEILALLIRLSERRAELGYPPGRKEFPDSEVLKRRFGSWSDALYAAENLDIWQHFSEKKADFPFFLFPEENAWLTELKDTAKKLERTPLKSEIREEARCCLRICFGSWDSVLRQAGLKPLEGKALEQAQRDARQRLKGKELIFRIMDLEPEYGDLLEEIKKLTEKLGRAPLKEEFDKNKRKNLQERCGSWRNALYQIDVMALDKQETVKVKMKIRNERRRQKI